MSQVKIKVVKKKPEQKPGEPKVLHKLTITVTDAKENGLRVEGFPTDINLARSILFDAERLIIEWNLERAAAAKTPERRLVEVSSGLPGGPIVGLS